MKAFFTSCLGSLVALITFTILVIFLVAGLGAETQVEIMPNSVLSLKLNYPITELELEDPIANFFPEAADQSMGLMQIKNAISRAKTDDNIKGIYINSGSVGAGIATIDEIRSSLEDFKKSGKWVVAYSDYFSEGGYYLASVADSIFLNPQGNVELNGLATEVMFFKKLFDKLDIKPQVFRVGEFKSAVEPFLRDNLSEENKLQLNSLLSGIYNNMLSQMGESRHIDANRLKEIAGKMEARSAAQAESLSLVDGLLYEDQVHTYIKNQLGIDEDETIDFVKYSDYKKSYAKETSSKNEVAVIVADRKSVV